jgi:hypothetical protein
MSTQPHLDNLTANERNKNLRNSQVRSQWQLTFLHNDLSLARLEILYPGT